MFGKIVVGEGEEEEGVEGVIKEGVVYSLEVVIGRYVDVEVGRVEEFDGVFVRDIGEVNGEGVSLFIVGVWVVIEVVEFVFFGYLLDVGF